MVYDELDNELIGFAKESISFDIENAEPHERICFHRGTNYYYINNGLKKLYAISRKYATKEILQAQIREMILPAILEIKQDFSLQSDILSSLHEKIKDSVKDNEIILPVTGLIVNKPFKIGEFILYPKEQYIQEKQDVLIDFDLKTINNDFASTIAMTHLRCHLDSAKQIGINILKSELNRLKAFIPYLNDSLKYWIQPLKTDETLSDCFFVFGNGKFSSGMAHVANLMPLDMDAKSSSQSKSFREFLNDRMYFQSIIEGKTKFWQALKMGYEWLGKQYDEDRLENKLIYSIFALECLLSNATNFSSISAAIAEKCAYLIGNSKEKKFEIFNLAKELYNLRSALVHGYTKDPITEDRIWQAYGLAMAVYRIITKMVVDGTISSQEEFDKYILEKKFE